MELRCCTEPPAQISNCMVTNFGTQYMFCDDFLNQEKSQLSQKCQ